MSVKILNLLPVTGDVFTPEMFKYMRKYLEPDTEVQTYQITSGPPSIECEYDEALAAPDVLRLAKQGEEDGFRASTHYDLALPKIDWDAQWKVSTERAYLSSDPTHPIYLGNNRRFDIDPTWYDLGAESPKKEEKETPPSCGCCCG